MDGQRYTKVERTYTEGEMSHSKETTVPESTRSVGTSPLMAT